MSIAILELGIGFLAGAGAIMAYTYPLLVNANRAVISARESIAESNKAMLDQSDLIQRQGQLISKYIMDERESICRGKSQ